MKRSRLARRTGLKGGAALARAPLARSDGFRRSSAQEGPLSPVAWRRAAFALSDGRCLMSGSRARDADDSRFDAHHPLAKQELRRRGLFAWVWDPRNVCWLTSVAHARHESAFERVPAERLPGLVWEFCGELDRLAGIEWASAYVLRFHPAAGVLRRS